MPDQSSPEVRLLRAAYAAFNARDIDAALATMSPNVVWQMAFKGGFVRGHEDIRAYWTQQWSEIDPHVEPVSFNTAADGSTVVEVRQTVRDLVGTILLDETVIHAFHIEGGQIARFEVRSVGSSPP